MINDKEKIYVSSGQKKYVGKQKNEMNTEERKRCRQYRRKETLPSIRMKETNNF